MKALILDLFPQRIMFSSPAWEEAAEGLSYRCSPGKALDIFPWYLDFLSIFSASLRIAVLSWAKFCEDRTITTCLESKKPRAPRGHL